MSEAIYVKALKSTVNVKEKSTGLELYNEFSCCDFATK